MHDLVFFNQARSNNGQSENGEDGIIMQIFEELNINCQFCVEFGAGDGINYSVTYPFRIAGAKSLLMDGIVEIDKDYLGRTVEANKNHTSAGVTAQSIKDSSHDVKIEFINAENINELFAKYKVPDRFQLLVIDIDGNEYHIWKALEYTPDVVMIEYNPFIRPDLNCTIPYDPNFKTTCKSRFVSASCSALAVLGAKKGYTLVEVDKINMFFVRSDLAGQLTTASFFQNDALSLYLKNLVKSDSLVRISKQDKKSQNTDLRKLLDELTEMYHSKDSFVWNRLNLFPGAHLYGPWEFLN